jgi:G6PDH family F420-dependent oxidoreductase
MATIGYFISSEEHSGSELVRGAVLAEQAGFPALWVSDHFHPWLENQGESPFVWAALGAIAASTEQVRVTTAVTCPTTRIHPAIIAQAAATTQELFGGRFALGVGTGEALNEHIFADHWPRPEVRRDMLEEAVAIMRALWTGETLDHDGEHYVVDNARLYTLPDREPDVIVSGFGPQSIDLAAKIGDGFATVQPDADAVKRYRAAGGRGVVQGGVKVCWGEDEAAAVSLAHRLWRNESLPGQLAQDLPTPTHFEQASDLVTETMTAQSHACGPDPERHVAAIQAYLDAGFDEVYVSQIGPDQAGMIDFYRREVLPRLGEG